MNEAVGNKELRQAIDDLNNVNSEGHGKSPKYLRMEGALQRLTDVIAKYYPQDGREAPVLSEEAMREVKEAYSTAIRRCNEYTKGKGDTRSSGYGQGRLICVKEIERILNQDMAYISGFVAGDKRTLPEMISRARVLETQITEEDLTIAKGSMTNRIPLAIETEEGVCEGFFTASKKQPPVSEIIDSVKHIEIEREVGPNLTQKIDLYHEKPIPQLVKRVVNHENPEAAWKAFLSECANMRRTLRKLSDKGKRTLETDPQFFMYLFEKSIDKYVGDKYDTTGEREALKTELLTNKAARDNFIDFVTEAGSRFSVWITNDDKGKIATGQDIPKRNVAASRMADVLGIGHLVARSEMMDLKDKEGNVMHGVFQEKAVGRDVSRLEDDDPFRKLGDHPEMLDDGAIIKQLADIQVMDYLLGNVDRHEGNLIYQIEDVNGEKKLVGFKAIDNDMCMGTVSDVDIAIDYGAFVTLPGDMKIISKERADAIKELNENKLRLMYQDLNFTEDEMRAAVSRLNNLKQAIANKSITVVSDDQLKDYKFQDLRNRGNYQGQKDEGPRMNIFDIVGGVVKKAKNLQSHSRGGAVHYNAAKSIEKEVKNNGPIHSDDLQIHLDLLEGVKAEFTRVDSWTHKDTGPFKFMKTTMNDCIDKIGEIRSKYQGNVEISAEDAQELDKIYRRLRKASASYAAGHANPSSPMGQARKAGSLVMRSLWPPRLTPPRPHVSEISVNDLANQNGLGEQVQGHARPGSQRNPQEQSINIADLHLDESTDGPRAGGQHLRQGNDSQVNGSQQPQQGTNYLDPRYQGNHRFGAMQGSQHIQESQHSQVSDSQSSQNSHSSQSSKKSSAVL